MRNGTVRRLDTDKLTCNDLAESHHHKTATHDPLGRAEAVVGDLPQIGKQETEELETGPRGRGGVEE